MTWLRGYSMHKKKIAIGLLFFMALLTTGCFSSGSLNIAEVPSKIIKGKSTKDDVRALLGEPQNVSHSISGDEYWSYFNTQTSYVLSLGLFSDTYPTDNCVMIFDDKGIVKDVGCRPGILK
jgi:hypothetical protein